MSDTVYVPPLVLSCQFQSIRWSPASKVSTLDYEPSSWWLVSSGGILSTTLWIQTFSTDHLHSAISNRMTSTSAAFPVFLLLFCMFFPRFLILWAASTMILLETLRNRPLQETAKHTILYPCSPPSSLCTSGLLLSCDSTQFSSHGTFSSIVTSVLDCLDTRTSSLVVD